MRASARGALLVLVALAALAWGSCTNCAVCSGETCLECDATYYVDGGACLRCLRFCEKCQNSSYCNVCQNFRESDGQCGCNKWLTPSWDCLPADPWVSVNGSGQLNSYESLRLEAESGTTLMGVQITNFTPTMELRFGTMLLTTDTWPRPMIFPVVGANYSGLEIVVYFGVVTFDFVTPACGSHSTCVCPNSTTCEGCITSGAVVYPELGKCACAPGFREVPLSSEILSCELVECVPGFKLNSLGVCEDFNECLSFPCDGNATCRNTIGSYACTCDYGYHGAGDVCHPVEGCVDALLYIDQTSTLWPRESFVFTQWRPSLLPEGTCDRFRSALGALECRGTCSLLSRDFCPYCCKCFTEFPCSDACTQCVHYGDELYECASCATGFRRNTSSTCAPCADPACVQCDVSSETCAWCLPGHRRREDGVCEVRPCDDNCALCDSAGGCYKCNPGYRSDTSAACESIACRTAPPPSLVPGLALGFQWPVGAWNSTVPIRCQGGYTPFGEVLCSVEGTWELNGARCDEKGPCSSLSLEGGVVDGENVTFGSNVSFSCDVRLVLVGARQTTCTEAGWRPPPPRCDCADHPGITNGRTVTDTRRLGSAARFNCNEGFTLSASATVVCTTTGWTGSPSCVAAGSAAPENSAAQTTVADPGANPIAVISFSVFAGTLFCVGVVVSAMALLKRASLRKDGQAAVFDHALSMTHYEHESAQSLFRGSLLQEPEVRSYPEGNENGQADNLPAKPLALDAVRDVQRMQWTRGKFLQSTILGEKYIVQDQLMGMLMTVEMTSLHERATVAAELASMFPTHPNIATFFGCDRILSPLDNKSYTCLFSEYSSGGSLNKFCSSIQLIQQLASTYIAQLLNALSSLHEMSVVFGALAPQCIIVDTALSPPVCKLADFGGATLLTEEMATFSERLHSFDHYIAPEVASPDKVADCRSDIFSIGCLLLWMTSGEPPFATLSGEEALRAVCSEEVTIPTGATDIVCDFLRLCFQRNPDERADLAALRKHALLAACVSVPEETR